MADTRINESLMNDALMRLRRRNDNRYREPLEKDVGNLCLTAITDLRRIGVLENFIKPFVSGGFTAGDGDALLKEAILTYAKANFGNNPDRERLMASYDMLITKIKGGKYYRGS